MFVSRALLLATTILSPVDDGFASQPRGPFRAPEPLPILNPSNFVPQNGFPVVKGLTSPERYWDAWVRVRVRVGVRVRDGVGVGVRARVRVGRHPLAQEKRHKNTKKIA